MRESACFQKSQSLTCITCHDPHHREDEPALHTATCYGCHQAKDCGEHTKLPVAVREKCIDCHMPNQPVMNITFATPTDEYIPLIKRHDHRIGVHPRATKMTLREWLLEQDDTAKRQQAAMRKRLITDELGRQAMSWPPCQPVVARISIRQFRSES